MIFYATGNAVPQYGGENRPGDNLFTDCLIALDPKTGKLRWHYQIVHHDIWEADVAEPPVLFDAQIEDHPARRLRACVPMDICSCSTALRGSPARPHRKSRAVPQDAFQKTSPTQPYPVGAELALPDCDYWRKQAVPAGFEVGCFFTPASAKKRNFLSSVYGMRATPMAFDPQTRFFYVTGDAGLQWFRRADDPDFFTLSLTSRVPGLSKLGYGVWRRSIAAPTKLPGKRNFPDQNRAVRSPPPEASCSKCPDTATPRRTTYAYGSLCGSFKRAPSAGARRSPLNARASSTSRRLPPATCGRSSWAQRFPRTPRP